MEATLSVEGEAEPKAEGLVAIGGALTPHLEGIQGQGLQPRHVVCSHSHERRSGSFVPVVFPRRSLFTSAVAGMDRGLGA